MLIYPTAPKAARIINSKILPLTTAVLGSILFISGCSQQENTYEDSASEESVSTEQAVDYASDADSPIGVMSDESNDSVAVAQDDTAKLTVENLAGDSEQTLGSQVADAQIKGKELLITASANFKVEDVVKSTSIIESLTRQQGGYVALSKTTNVESDSRTFVKGEQNVTVTTYYRQAQMTARVPKEKVSSFLKQVQQQVAFLNEQEFSAQDVTLDIYREQLAAKLNSDMVSDLSQERLNSKNAKDQSSNVDSITATYAARQQQEYAKLEQMNIADKVKYSTIDLIFTQPDSSYKETTQNLDVIIDAERPSFGSQVGTAFVEGWEMLRLFTITLIQLWWLLIVLGVFYLIYKGIKIAYRKLFKPRTYKAQPKRKQLPEKKINDNVDEGL